MIKSELDEIFYELASIGNVFDEMGNPAFEREISAAKKRIRAFPRVLDPENAPDLRKIADLLKSCADHLRELGWTLQADDAEIVAEKAEKLADKAEVVRHANK
jgi:hypothetical protein